MMIEVIKEKGTNEYESKANMWTAENAARRAVDKAKREIEEELYRKSCW